VLMRMRSELIEEPFARCLELLQQLDIRDVLDVIQFALEFMRATDPACVEPSYLSRVYETVMREEKLDPLMEVVPQHDSDMIHRFAKHFNSFRRHGKKNA